MNMFMRRTIAAAVMAAAIISPALAQDWKQQYPELSIGISSGENETDAIARTQGYADYLSRTLGVPVSIVRGTDYAAVIEAMRAGQIQFASIGPANYALARKVMGDLVTPVAVQRDKEGALGYYSVIAVRADSPYQTLEDIKGKSFAFADPNSTSGYAVPSYYLSTVLGTSADEYFSETAFSGGHEQSVIALLAGTFEAVATHQTNDHSGNIPRMVEKGMIPAGSTRIIWTSPLIPNSPTVMRTDLPEELKTAFTNAVFAFPEADPAAFEAYTSGNSKGYAPAKHEDYLDVIAITEYNAKQRRANAN
ncbi:MAG: phnD [Devosia sp.]|uniref:phosphonate ABC transporter substrate-binding protein n=1 Tax=Devosia sp. TaxID=1871048 RepID=UPI00262AAB77|nr:phosphonate ABC transporter substrate-binding protein [Devosia sp.]MDB5528139.1 phnD [Devosia sp.]